MLKRGKPFATMCQIWSARDWTSIH